jgi:alginate O-acetyltransferase complex protein AlgI
MDINSWNFLVISLAGIIACHLFYPSILRSVMLLCINIYFMFLLIKDLNSGLYLLLVLVSIYLLGLWKVRRMINWSSILQLLVVAGMWGLLFITKDPTIFAPINPFFQFPVQVIGLSYLIFRGISYVMEVDLSKNVSPLTYLNYMLFFPMIFAGPIERYNEYQQQINKAVEVGGDEVLSAMHRVAKGFIKKFILADNLAAFGILSVGHMADTSAPMLWLGAIAQLFIIYLDFSGYCDIVIGTARLMGFRLRENFDHPFRSTNIQVFWERWHISLGQMIRDYVFNPLAKFSLVRTPRKYHLSCFTITYCFSMLLVALWHGTTYGFMIFGVVQAIALLLYQIYKNSRNMPRSSPTNKKNWYHNSVNIFFALCTYLFVSLSITLWIVADKGSLSILKKMVGLS